MSVAMADMAGLVDAAMRGEGWDEAALMALADALGECGPAERLEALRRLVPLVDALPRGEVLGVWQAGVGRRCVLQTWCGRRVPMVMLSGQRQPSPDGTASLDTFTLALPRWPDYAAGVVYQRDLPEAGIEPVGGVQEGGA